MPEIKDKGIEERFDILVGQHFTGLPFKNPRKEFLTFIHQEIQQALQRERDLWLEKLPLYRAGVLDVSAGETYESRKSRNDTLKEIKEIIK